MSIHVGVVRQRHPAWRLGRRSVRGTCCMARRPAGLFDVFFHRDCPKSAVLRLWFEIPRGEVLSRTVGALVHVL